ncbi:brix domain-containing protein [Peziza echinospora]|nr:brix domain-containing protein [Peziza echinospora]
MPKPKPDLVETKVVKKTFEIKNKLARLAYNVRIKTAAGGSKHKFRADRRREEAKAPEARAERLKANIPITLDRKRVWDERVDGAYDALLAEKRRKLDEEEPEVAEQDEDEEDEEKDLEKEKLERKKKRTKAEHGVPDISDEEFLELQAHLAYEAAQLAKAEAAEAAQLYASATTSIPGLAGNLPKLLITTSRNSHMHDPAHELTTLFPNSTYIPRGRPSNTARKGARGKPKQFSIPEICAFASSPPPDPATKEPVAPYTHVAVINDHRKVPSAMTIIVLPAGPSFHFSLTNFKPSTAIHNHGRATSHTPELILNNFLTPLGKLAAGLFQSMFPPVPELGGRQVVTAHNQRDYIFFRRHRYVFRDRRETEKAAGYGLDHGANTLNPVSEGVEERDLGVKVGLQEIGPQFTLKLRRVERGIVEGVEWQWKGQMEKERRKFQL